MSEINYEKWITIGIAALSALLMHFMFFIDILSSNKSNVVIIILALVPILVIAYAITTWFENREKKFKY